MMARTMLATCEVCGNGHGVEADGSFFCCAHCAQESGIGALRDRA